MLDFIAKYWLQFIFGIVSAGLLAWCRHYRKLWKNEHNRQESDKEKQFFDKVSQLIAANHEDIMKVISEEEIASKEADKEIFHIIGELKDELEILRDGLLSIQGRQFKAECEIALQPDYIITLEKYKNLMNEHSVYNSLGGNHEGDKLFELVTQKYQSQLK